MIYAETRERGNHKSKEKRVSIMFPEDRVKIKSWALG